MSLFFFKKIIIFFHRCSRLGLVSLSYLWRRDQTELLESMISGGMEAVIVKVAALGLDRQHLGKTLEQMKPHLKNLVSEDF